jgi:hypothetical protein
VTKKTFKDLAAAAEALEQATAGSAHPFTFGKHELVPEDRSAIRANGFHQTSDGAEVHEGTLVLQTCGNYESFTRYAFPDDEVNDLMR